MLAHRSAYPKLESNTRSIGLLPTGVGAAAGDAYRELRRAQHVARLDEQPTQLPPEAMAAECAAIQRLWQTVFT